MTREGVNFDLMELDCRILKPLAEEFMRLAASGGSTAEIFEPLARVLERESELRDGGSPQHLQFRLSVVDPQQALHAATKVHRLAEQLNANVLAAEPMLPEASAAGLELVKIYAIMVLFLHSLVDALVQYSHRLTVEAGAAQA
jgi:hypothetical protein